MEVHQEVVLQQKVKITIELDQHGDEINNLFKLGFDPRSPWQAIPWGMWGGIPRAPFPPLIPVKFFSDPNGRTLI